MTLIRRRSKLITSLWKQLLLIALLLSAPLSCLAEINVSRTFSTHVLQEQVNVGAGQLWTYPLPGNSAGDVFRIRIAASNAVWKDISAFVVDADNANLARTGQSFRAQGFSKRVTPFDFEATRSWNGQAYLVIDNRYANFITKKVGVAVTLTTQLPEEVAQKLEGMFRSIYSMMKARFEFQDFDINVQRCGQVNAQSETKTGDITMCSELISQYASNPSVLLFTFMHEVGHTFLNLWGLPGGDNEDMADEFASAVILQSKDGVTSLLAALDFFKGRNSYAEATHAIQQGDRHSLSIQRVRNIRGLIEQPRQLEAKWNRLLYPHMTRTALQDVIERPGVYDDSPLARQELAKRGESGKSDQNISARQGSAPPTSSGCSKDTDCKGDRICEQGQCMAPRSSKSNIYGR